MDATGYKFQLLNADGTYAQTGAKDILWSCGYGSYLGNNATDNYSSPIQIGSLTNWKQISSGYDHTLSVKIDGTLWAWGRNQYGQLGNENRTQYYSPIQIGNLTNWTQVATGSYFSVAVKTDGTLWAWGINSFGNLGNGTTINYSSPIQIGSLTTWKQVSIQNDHTAAIKTDGTLWTWGFNFAGELGNGTPSTQYSSPIQVGLLTNWSQVSAGPNYTIAVKTDGTLWGFGRNYQGSLGNGTTISYSSPIQIGALTNWKQISCGASHTAAVKTDGTLWTWGYNPKGNLGNGTVNVYYSSPIQVGSLTNWNSVKSGRNSIGAITTTGALWMCGYNKNGRLGIGNTIDYSSPVQVGSLNYWKQVDFGNDASSAFTTLIAEYYYNNTVDMSDMFVPKSLFGEVTLLSWGTNQYGERGNATTTNISIPTVVTRGAEGSNWKDIDAATERGVMGIRTNGTLWGWGWNNYGNLGIGNTLHCSTPVQVGSLNTWKQVASNDYCMHAIKTDGTMWVSGYNWEGVMGGAPNRVYYSSPVQVGALTNWKQVSAGSYHTMAIKTDGTLWGWGQGFYGYLGYGGTDPVSSPVQVGALTNWKQVSCGQWNSAAVKTDGTLWVWGGGNNYAIGNGTLNINYSSPIQIGTATNWSQVSCGYYNMAAVKTDGTLWTWGRNDYGQCGQGNTANIQTPTQVGLLTNWKSVYVTQSAYFAMATKTDGTLWAWGNNYCYLGNGTTNNQYSSPIQIGSLSNWKKINFGFGIASDDMKFV